MLLASEDRDAHKQALISVDSWKNVYASGEGSDRKEYCLLCRVKVLRGVNRA